MCQNPMAKKGRAKQVRCWRKMPIEVFSIMTRWQGFQDPYGAPVNPGVSFDMGSLLRLRCAESFASFRPTAESQCQEPRLLLQRE